jgi:hypothetical protein
VSDPYTARSFDEFWPHYVRMHSRRETQLAHAMATTTCGALMIAAMAKRSPALLLLAPIVDHAIAQVSHRAFQKNATTPWKRPSWHARAELRMLRLVLTGRMRAETRRHL